MAAVQEVVPRRGMLSRWRSDADGPSSRNRWDRPGADAIGGRRPRRTRSVTRAVATAARRRDVIAGAGFDAAHVGVANFSSLLGRSPSSATAARTTMETSAGARKRTNP